jgi:hypothetical protein
MGINDRMEVGMVVGGFVLLMRGCLQWNVYLLLGRGMRIQRPREGLVSSLLDIRMGMEDGGRVMRVVSLVVGRIIMTGVRLLILRGRFWD